MFLNTCHRALTRLEFKSKTGVEEILERIDIYKKMFTTCKTHFVTDEVN